MNPRYQAINAMAAHKPYQIANPDKSKTSENFGSNVFHLREMKKTLPKEIYQNVLNAYNGKETLKEEYANAIAIAIKEWALSHGATHYCHWFQPLTGASAEKHDSFIDWTGPSEVIEKFSGNQLIQGEPDASSFPSGGLRSTYEARGYTSWDPTSPPFIWEGGDGKTLCIPSVFFSWTGDVLDFKIPFLRSEKKINDAAVRLLNLMGIETESVASTLGLEQEYFVIDRTLAILRPDLLLTGRTLFGASPSKGQELQDHYFGAVKDRILSFMCDFENAAIKLGIPVKTRHNEVAPAQYEVAPIYEKGSAAIDHNILLMEIMRQTAEKHRLCCLLHEKPFAGLNGSGKHMNWSLLADNRLNLFSPSETPENNLHFLVLITAVLRGIHQHAGLLRASVGSAHNDHRLGGHEAPPAIMSVYLGEELEEVLHDIETTGNHIRKTKKGKVSLGIPSLLDLPKDTSDRNRTSPFAFTGNKFEMRALGASANPSFSATVLNAAVAESLNLILDEIESSLEKKNPTKEEILKTTINVIRKHLKVSLPIRFSGDNYTAEWAKEAKKRKIPNIAKSTYAFETLLTQETKHLFNGILTDAELKSRYEILLEHYSQHTNIEAKTLIELYRTSILPAALKMQTETASAIIELKKIDGKFPSKEQKKLLHHLSHLIELSLTLSQTLEKERSEAEKLPLIKMAKAFCGSVAEQMESLRKIIDELEQTVDDRFWIFPKYRELLYLL